MIHIIIKRRDRKTLITTVHPQIIRHFYPRTTRLIDRNANHAEIARITGTCAHLRNNRCIRRMHRLFRR